MAWIGEQGRAAVLGAVAGSLITIIGTFWANRSANSDSLQREESADLRHKIIDIIEVPNAQKTSAECYKALDRLKNLKTLKLTDMTTLQLDYSISQFEFACIELRSKEVDADFDAAVKKWETRPGNSDTIGSNLLKGLQDQTKKTLDSVPPAKTSIEAIYKTFKNGA